MHEQQNQGSHSAGRSPEVQTFTGRVRHLCGWIRRRQHKSGLRGLGRELLIRLRHAYDAGTGYRRWIDRYDSLGDGDRLRIRAQVESMAYRPTFSIVMPVYNSAEKWLNQAIASVERQLYPDWELCIADDASTKDHVWPLLQRHAARDPRIKCVRRDRNGHISAASNSALELATGEFIALLDHDDEISEHALFLIAEELQTFPDAQIIYTDEDKIDERGRRCEPFLKPDWSPQLLRSLHYVSHLGVYRANLVHEVQGFREGFEGCQDYDLLLRCSERIKADQVRHVPHVLYHWRRIPGSLAAASDAKPNISETATRVLNEHLTRIAQSGRAELCSLPWAFRVRPERDQDWPGVSLIVRGSDGHPCRAEDIHALLDITDYPDLEILVEVDACEDHLALPVDESVAIVRTPLAPGRSELQATVRAADSASKPFLCFINSDLEFRDPDWLKELVHLALDHEVGVVGGRILNVQGFSEHCGYVVGPGRKMVSLYRGCRADFVAPFASINVVRNCSAVSARCLLVQRSVFEELDGFDDTCADVEQAGVDLCFRARSAQYQVVWTPFATARVRHGGSPAPCEPQVPASVENELIEHYHSHNLTQDASGYRLSWPPRVNKSWI
ncbi:MAG: glycosyltransferase [Planctomycetaceae bacterium]